MPERDYMTPTPAELLKVIERIEGLAVAASRDGWVDSPVATSNLANGIILLAVNLRRRILREMEPGGPEAIPADPIDRAWLTVEPPPPAHPRITFSESDGKFLDEFREKHRGDKARSRGPFGLWPFARRRAT